MLVEMSCFEAAAYAHMLDKALERHLRNQKTRVPVRLQAVRSYAWLAAVLREWEYAATEAVLLRDQGTAIRVDSVTHLEEHEAWPPRGTLAAADGTWVLEQDGRVTRLY